MLGSSMGGADTAAEEVQLGAAGQGEGLGVVGRGGRHSTPAVRLFGGAVAEYGWQQQQQQQQQQHEQEEEACGRDLFRGTEVADPDAPQHGAAWHSLQQQLAQQQQEGQEAGGSGAAAVLAGADPTGSPSAAADLLPDIDLRLSGTSSGLGAGEQAARGRGGRDPGSCGLSLQVDDAVAVLADQSLGGYAQAAHLGLVNASAGRPLRPSTAVARATAGALNNNSSSSQEGPGLKGWGDLEGVTVLDSQPEEEPGMGDTGAVAQPWAGEEENLWVPRSSKRPRPSMLLEELGEDYLAQHNHQQQLRQRRRGGSNGAVLQELLLGSPDAVQQAAARQLAGQPWAHQQRRRQGRQGAAAVGLEQLDQQGLEAAGGEAQQEAAGQVLAALLAQEVGVDSGDGDTAAAAAAAAAMSCWGQPGPSRPVTAAGPGGCRQQPLEVSDSEGDDVEEAAGAAAVAAAAAGVGAGGGSGVASIAHVQQYARLAAKAVERVAGQPPPAAGAAGAGAGGARQAAGRGAPTGIAAGGRSKAGGRGGRRSLPSPGLEALGCSVFVPLEPAEQGVGGTAAAAADVGVLGGGAAAAAARGSTASAAQQQLLGSRGRGSKRGRGAGVAAAAADGGGSGGHQLLLGAIQGFACVRT
jgi:hypothetical protein